MDAIVFLLVLVALISPSLALGAFYDLSAGNAGLQYPCPPGNLGFLARPADGWIVFDLGNLIPGDAIINGTVLTSRNRRSCFRTPDYFEVHSNFTYQMQIYLTTATNTPIFYVWLVDKDENAHLIVTHEEFVQDGWYVFNIEMDTSSSELKLPGNYLLEFWSTMAIEMFAFRWVGISDETLPPKRQFN